MRSIPRSTASSNGTSTRSIESVGTDSSRGLIITLRTDNDVNWRGMQETRGENSGTKGREERAKGKEKRERHY